MNDIITIDLNKLNKEKTTDLVIAKDGSLALEAEAELNKILATRDLLDRLIDYVKERLQEEMNARKLIKVKGGSLTISKRAFGGRYSLGINPSDDFKQLVSYDKVNTEAVDAYLEQNGKLPDGIILKDREEKISITKRGEE